jgi:hypothetical protein
LHATASMPKLLIAISPPALRMCQFWTWLRGACLRRRYNCDRTAVAVCHSCLKTYSGIQALLILRHYFTQLNVCIALPGYSKFHNFHNILL